MPNDLIRYDLLVQEALCGVVKKVLGDVARHGLPGDHHFYITFRTHAPGVRLSSRMREQYPEEMTIILQHQFEDLKVSEQSFEVGLSFKGVPEVLLVPFDALTGFFDPSVPFNFKFEPQPNVDSEEPGEPSAAAPSGPRALPMPAPTPPPLAAVPKTGAFKTGASNGGASKNGAAKSGTPDKSPPPERPKAPEKPAAVDKPAPPEKVASDAAGARGEAAKVVSIDAFRKKP